MLLIKGLNNVPLTDLFKKKPKKKTVHLQPLSTLFVPALWNGGYATNVLINNKTINSTLIYVDWFHGVSDRPAHIEAWG